MKFLGTAAALLTVCLGLYAATSLLDIYFRSDIPARASGPADSRLLERQLSPIPVERRPVMPYSVIPGGVQSQQEFEYKRQADPVVGEHYKGVHVTGTGKTSKSQRLYASFRVGSQVCWTRSRIVIRPGEPVLVTDDPNVFIRVQCGNQLRPKLPFHLRVGISVPENDRITTLIAQTPPLLDAELPPVEDRVAYYIPSIPFFGDESSRLPSAGSLLFRLPEIPPAANSSVPAMPWLSLFLAGFYGPPVTYPWIAPAPVVPCCDVGVGIGVAPVPEPSPVQTLIIGLLLVAGLVAYGRGRNT